MGEILAASRTSIGVEARSGTRVRLELCFSARATPTVFMPVSPPPYMNGGVEFLSWVIESTKPSFTPDQCADWLEGRLPRPVDDLEKWRIDEG